MKRYLIAGDGVAGARAAIKIRELDPAGEIHIFTEEAYPLYYRVRFPELIAGEISPKDIIIHRTEYYNNQNISLHLEERVTGGNVRKREIITEKGNTYSYDLFLLATGAHAFVPPIKGVEKEGVFTLRSMQSAIYFKEYSEGTRNAILIGGGLVGLETGGALLRRGIKVAVVESFPRILPRQMDPEGSRILQDRLERIGFSFLLNNETEEILGEKKVEGIRLKGGRTVEGETVIISAGVRPNLALARTLGLQTRNGILVDDTMGTTSEGVFAAGDVAEHRGRCYGIWPAAQRQGETAGVTMAGGTTVYEGTIVSNTLKVVGISLTSAGEIDPEGNLQSLVRRDQEKGTYCKVTFKEDRIVGCILLGEVEGRDVILGAVEKKTKIDELKDTVLSKKFATTDTQ